MLIDSAKIPECKRSISPFSFYGNCLTTSHASYPYRPSRWIYPFVLGVNEGNENAGWIEVLSFLFSVLIKGMRKWAQSKIFFCNTRGEGGGEGAISSNLLRVGWCNLVCGGVCRWQNKWWLVFALLGVYATLGVEFGMSLGLFQDFRDGFIKS